MKVPALPADSSMDQSPFPHASYFAAYMMLERDLVILVTCIYFLSLIHSFLPWKQMLAITTTGQGKQHDQLGRCRPRGTQEGVKGSVKAHSGAMVK